MCGWGWALPDECYMHAHAAVHGTAIQADIDPIGECKPRRVALGAIETHFVVRLCP